MREELLPRTTRTFDSHSSDEDCSSDEEYNLPQRTLLKPVFISKQERRTLDDEVANVDKRTSAHEMLSEYMKKEFEKSQANELIYTGFVDDTDFPDDEEEFQAWKLRELARIKQEREEFKKFELEKNETEKIREMDPIEKNSLLRMKEKEYLEANPKGEHRFLQKYFHKGAFFRDSDEKVLKRNFAEPTLDDRMDRSMLPEVMQVRNFGKASRSKWKHLSAEDTTAHHEGWYDESGADSYRRIVRKMGGTGDVDRKKRRT